jgi:probable addiction module antidote protein
VRESIKNPRRAAAYLSAAAQDDDGRVFLIALRDVIEVHGGISTLARKAKISRAQLTRMLAGTESPRLDYVSKVLRVSGLQLSIRHREGNPKRKARA